MKEGKSNFSLFSLCLTMVVAVLVISGAAFLFVHLKTGPAGRENYHSSRSLEIKDADSRKVYGRWPLKEAGEFTIEFIHSVNQSPVRETFVIENNLIQLHAVRFFSYGAGMSSDLEEGWKLSRDGDAMIITGFSNSFNELNYIVGTVSDHLLFVNGETVSLRELCGRNAHITIRIR